MRVNHVEKSRKSPGNCGSCRKEIPAGAPYKWAQGRYTDKKIRCGECQFRPSDLTGSDKLSRVYAAQETLQDFLASWSNDDGLDGLQDACSTAAEEIREVAQEYSDAAEAMGGAGEEMQEKADNLEGWAEEIEDAGNQGEEFEVSFEDSEDCPVCGMTADLERGHAEEGHYLCSNAACGHDFKLEEQKNGNSQTREEWADEIRSQIEDALGNCPV